MRLIFQEDITYEATQDEVVTALGVWADYWDRDEGGSDYEGMKAVLDVLLTTRIDSERAEAWDEGAESAYYSPDIRGLVDYPDNPYRRAES